MGSQTDWKESQDNSTCRDIEEKNGVSKSKVSNGKVSNGRISRNKKRCLLIIALALVLALTAGGYRYINDYYHAGSAAEEVLHETHESVAIEEISGKQIAFIPEEPVAGLIFYPGGKVAYESYAPLMEKLAEKGVLCVLLHMPGNLAILDGNAAKDIPEQFPQVEDWYISGHSLGGVAASGYAAKHSEELKGLILLASYTMKDLSASGLKILSVYGTEDGVVNRQNYEKAKEKLPEDAVEYVIDGGCHAWFGDYGMQDGDGEAKITPNEQQEQTVQQIVKLIE